MSFESRALAAVRRETAAFEERFEECLRDCKLNADHGALIDGAARLVAFIKDRTVRRA